MEVVFWISLSVLFYAYIGYGLLLSLLHAFSRNKKLFNEAFLPHVTVIVPAYNEEPVIRQKIQNCLSLDYPQHLLTLLFVTDGSTDNTPQLVARYSVIVHLHQPERRGKTAALNRAMQQVSTPVVVFTDANALLHTGSLRKMMRHYQDKTIGGVSGEKRILAADNTAVSAGEGLYWRYESMLKKADASFYTVIGAAGELFSIRTALFEPLQENIILDDFVLSARICLKGYRFAYEGEAYAIEAPSENIREEQTRKVRISAGCFQALVLLKELLNPLRNWKLTFQYVSHRVLRWVVCPLLVLLVFVANAWLFVHQPQIIYSLCFWLQGLFYLLAFLGWLIAEKEGVPKLLFVPYYFVFMNLSLIKGFFRFLSNGQSVNWNKAARKEML
jgi:poly-beta-1,6-N-acetyl-D-glucosamine synthase